MATAKTLKQVNQAIKKEIGNVELNKGYGYFYITSEDPEIGLKLSALFSNSIYVCHLKQQSVCEWIQDVKRITNNINF
jgi:hypothetical protein